MSSTKSINQSTDFTSVHINDLPNELLFNIFSCLFIQDRVSARQVCLRWSKLVMFSITKLKVFGSVDEKKCRLLAEEDELVCRQTEFGKFEDFCDLIQFPCLSLQELQFHIPNFRGIIPEKQKIHFCKLFDTIATNCPNLKSFYLNIENLFLSDDDFNPLKDDSDDLVETWLKKIVANLTNFYFFVNPQRPKDNQRIIRCLNANNLQSLFLRCLTPSLFEQVCDYFPNLINFGSFGSVKNLESLRKFPKLKHFAFSGNMTQPEVIETLDQIKLSRQIQTLDIRNHLKPSCRSWSLLKNFVSLQSLATQVYGQHQLQLIAQNCPRLQRLNFCSNSEHNYDLGCISSLQHLEFIRIHASNNGKGFASFEFNKMPKIRYFYFSMLFYQFWDTEKQIVQTEIDTDKWSYRECVLKLMKDVAIAFPNLEFVHLVYPYDDVQPLLDFVDKLPRLKQFYLIYNATTGKEHGKSFPPHFIQRKIQFSTELSQGMHSKCLDFDLYKMF